MSGRSVTRLASVAPDDLETEPTVLPVQAGALAAWQAALSNSTRAVHIGSDLLAPALRKDATVIVDPTLDPVPGDLVEVGFQTGQALIFELVRRTSLTVTLCAPLTRRTYRQFQASDIVSVAAVVAIIPPGRFPESHQGGAHAAEL